MALRKICVCIVLGSFFTLGCRIPDGTNGQISGVGMHLFPFGNSPAAPKLSIGSVASTYTTAAPADAAPTLNRVAIETAGVSSHVATIAQGSVGQELGAAGNVLPETLNALGSPRTSYPGLGPQILSEIRSVPDRVAESVPQPRPDLEVVLDEIRELQNSAVSPSPNSPTVADPGLNRVLEEIRGLPDRIDVPEPRPTSVLVAPTNQPATYRLPASIGL